MKLYNATLKKKLNVNSSYNSFHYQNLLNSLSNVNKKNFINSIANLTLWTEKSEGSSGEFDISQN